MLSPFHSAFSCHGPPVNEASPINPASANPACKARQPPPQQDEEATRREGEHPDNSACPSFCLTPHLNSRNFLQTTRRKQPTSESLSQTLPQLQTRCSNLRPGFASLTYTRRPASPPFFRALFSLSHIVQTDICPFRLRPTNLSSLPEPRTELAPRSDVFDCCTFALLQPSSVSCTPHVVQTRLLSTDITPSRS